MSIRKTIVKVLLLSLIAAILSQCKKDDEVNHYGTILDTRFLNALIERGVDTDGDSIISSSEAEVIVFLNISGENISDLTGIEAFVNLVTLICPDNKLTSLHVRKNTKLSYLDCYSNQIAGLDVSENSDLLTLHCGVNSLNSLNVSKNTKLISLECIGNQLSGLDVSNCPDLEDLFCHGNNLKNLNVSKNTKLKILGCNSNQLTNLDVSKNPELNYLDCGANHLTTLDISKNPDLSYLDCGLTQLTTLDLTNNSTLEVLFCYNDSLTTLDISNNITLKSLDISYMPFLSKVCVWTIPFPPAGVTVDITGSPDVYFTMDCN